MLINPRDSLRQEWGGRKRSQFRSWKMWLGEAVWSKEEILDLYLASVQLYKFLLQTRFIFCRLWCVHTINKIFSTLSAAVFICPVTHEILWIFSAVPSESGLPICYREFPYPLLADFSLKSPFLTSNIGSFCVLNGGNFTNCRWRISPNFSPAVQLNSFPK